MEDPQSLSQDSSPSLASYNALHHCLASSIQPPLCPFLHIRYHSAGWLYIPCVLLQRPVSRQAQQVPLPVPAYLPSTSGWSLSKPCLTLPWATWSTAPWEERKGEATQDAGLTRRPSPTLPDSSTLNFL